MKYGFVYETTNLSNGMKYIGSHKRTQNPKDPDDSWYLGSGKHINNSFKKAYKELGDDWRTRYRRVILEDCDSLEELRERESYYLKSVDAENNPIYYNSTNSGYQSYPVLRGENNPNYKGKAFTEETKKKMSETKKHKYAVGETVPWNKGKQMPEEFCRRISDTWDYDKHYGEGSTTREKMSRNRKEKYARGELVNPTSLPGVCEKISISMKEGYASGRIKKLYGEDNPASRPEVKEKIRKSVKEAMQRPDIKAKNLARGEKLRNDKEFSRKISEGRMGEKNPCYGKIWINNGEINRRVHREDFERFYIQEGFEEGRLSKPYGKRKN